jgi:hypothetical protein
MPKTLNKSFRNLTALLLVIVPVFLLLASFPAHAQTDLFGGQESNINANIGLTSQPIQVIVARLINILLGLLGIIALSTTVYAGYLWMTSGGDATKIEKAKKMIMASIIGLIIIMSSYALVRYFLGRFYGGAFGGPNGNGAGGNISGVLGKNIVESHYPARNALDVVRNTSIVVTFRESLNPATVISNTNGGILGNCTTPGDLSTCDKVNAANVLIYESKKGSAFALTDVAGFYDAASKNFVFKPVQYLGSPSEKIWYTVALTSGIKKADGSNAFASTGYTWTFEVGTRIDTVPPQILSIWPIPASTEPKNTIIQINFSEAINPLSASGPSTPTSTFTNLLVSSSSAQVNGGFYISNGYRTVEFVSDNACGVNSCGQTVYCLPGLSNIDVDVLAASTSPFFPYNGVIDMADNSMDGNLDNQSDGPTGQSGHPSYDYNAPDAANQGDSVKWRFKTSDVVDITPPRIDLISPTYNQSIGDFAMPISARFNKVMMGSSIIDNIDLNTAATSTVSFWPTWDNDLIAKKTTILINHEQFAEKAKYSPQFKGGLSDVYQNCYSPASGVACTPVAPNKTCCNGVPTAAATCP